MKVFLQNVLSTIIVNLQFIPFLWVYRKVITEVLLGNELKVPILTDWTLVQFILHLPVYKNYQKTNKTYNVNV